MSLEKRVNLPKLARRMRFRIVVDKERCKGCDLCVAVCSRHVFLMTKKLNSKGCRYPETQDLSQCTGCQQCALICPDAAIEIDVEDDS